MSDRARMMGQVVFLTVALAVFWLAFVANLTADDLLLGIPAVLLSVGFAFFAIRKLPIRFQPKLRDVVQVWRLPGDVAIDVIQVLWVLVRDFAGRRAPSLFRAVSWPAVEDTPHATALRCLAIAYTTVSPNCIVIGIDRERGQFFFHELTRSAIRRMTRNLGAGGGA
jgi:multisubunit Na+/H+ antiporter MnhE subunit